MVDWEFYQNLFVVWMVVYFFVRFGYLERKWGGEGE